MGLSDNALAAAISLDNARIDIGKGWCFPTAMPGVDALSLDLRRVAQNACFEDMRYLARFFEDALEVDGERPEVDVSDVAVGLELLSDRFYKATWEIDIAEAASLRDVALLICKHASAHEQDEAFPTRNPYMTFFAGHP